MLLQKLVLARRAGRRRRRCGAAGPPGRAPTSPGSSRSPSIIWNPFVAERLVIGHWPVLLGYGVAAVAGRRGAALARRTGRPPPQLWCSLPLGSLSASAGLVTAVVAARVRRWRGRTAALARAGRPGGRRERAVAGRRPAARAERGDRPARRRGVRAGRRGLAARAARRAVARRHLEQPRSCPVSRTGFQAWVALVFLVTLAAVGARSWWRHEPRRDAWAYVGCWVAGMVVALADLGRPGRRRLAGRGGARRRPAAGRLPHARPLRAADRVLVAAEGARVSGAGCAEPPVLRSRVGATLAVLPARADAGRRLGRRRPAPAGRLPGRLGRRA